MSVGMYVGMWVCTPVCRYPPGQKRASYSWDLEQWAIMNCIVGAEN